MYITKLSFQKHRKLFFEKESLSLEKERGAFFLKGKKEKFVVAKRKKKAFSFKIKESSLR